MKITVTEIRFIYTFKFNATLKDNFSNEGLKALFSYLVESEKETGQEMEFSPVSICLDFAEYGSLSDFIQNHPDYEGLEPKEIENRLRKKTTVIIVHNDFENGFIVQDF